MSEFLGSLEEIDPEFHESLRTGIVEPVEYAVDGTPVLFRRPEGQMTHVASITNPFDELRSRELLNAIRQKVLEDELEVYTDDQLNPVISLGARSIAALPCILGLLKNDERLVILNVPLAPDIPQDQPYFPTNKGERINLPPGEYVFLIHKRLPSQGVPTI